MHCSNRHNGANENIAAKDDEHNEWKGSWKKWCKWSPFLQSTMLTKNCNIATNINNEANKKHHNKTKFVKCCNKWKDHINEKKCTMTKSSQMKLHLKIRW